MGGSDIGKNLVILTAREHFIAHRLLTKIYPEQGKLKQAMFLMVNLTRYAGCVNSRVFEYAKEQAAGVYSKESLKHWKDPTFRKKTCKAISDGYKNPDAFCNTEESRENRRQAMMQFHKNNVLRPWQAPKATPTKHLWGLAQSFYEMSKFNPNVVGKPMGATRFNTRYGGGKNVRIFWRMEQMFKEGWVPIEDELWLEDFSDSM
jgi:hypothetical protein